MVVRGVPESLAKDAWWMDDETGGNRLRWLPGALLLLTVALADQLVWVASGGIGLVVWALSLAACAHIVLSGSVGFQRGMIAWSLLGISLLPAVEVVQTLSVMFLVFGLAGFAAVLVLGRWDLPAILRAVVRLPAAGLAQDLRDTASIRMTIPSAGTIKDGLRDWLMPLGVGMVFVSLMAAANPLVDNWLTQLSWFDERSLWDVDRMIFWTGTALIVWPFLRLTAMTQVLGVTPAAPKMRWQSGLVNARSVMRALVMFNLIFAVQTLLDLAYLWGGVALPDGMTYATYAHRGAYPLVATALLAGVFALIAQPFLGDRPALRGLLYLWVAQTVLLVVSSILRLDLYVEAYGLTRLRCAAFLWMMVTALGLVLIIWQMARRRSVGWFMLQAFGLGMIALYAAALINVDGMVARHNLAAGHLDAEYLCELGEGAVPAISELAPTLCDPWGLHVTTPGDWREWGYRNARLRNSLAAMKTEVQQ